MFHIFRFIIWFVGTIVVVSFLLNFFHYEIDWKYVKESQQRCFGIAIECQKTIEKEGAKNAKCPIACLEFKKLVKKK